MSSTKEAVGAIGGLLTVVALAIVPFAAWITHIVHCIRAEEWLFLIAGALAFPIAMIHGVGLWFGWF